MFVQNALPFRRVLPASAFGADIHAQSLWLLARAVNSYRAEPDCRCGKDLLFDDSKEMSHDISGSEKVSFTTASVIADPVDHALANLVYMHQTR